MLDNSRLKREKLERGGLLLSYIGSDSVRYNVSIDVDEVKCVGISLGNDYNTFLRYDLLRRDDRYSADIYLGFIKDNMDEGLLPNEKYAEVYKQLLDDGELHICLANAINSIPSHIEVEEAAQIDLARQEYEVACKEALDIYQRKLRSIVSRAKDVSNALSNCPKESNGLVSANTIRSFK